MTFILQVVYCLLWAFSSSVNANDSLTIIDPCPLCPSSAAYPLITVTAQYQTASTCTPETICTTESLILSSSSTSVSTLTTTCTTNYPCSEYSWVSTIIPCAGSDGVSTECTVTTLDQPVTISHLNTSLTTYSTIYDTTFTSIPDTTTTATSTSTSTSDIKAIVVERNIVPYVTARVVITNIDVIIVNYVAKFYELGPLAVPGYAGSGLCQACAPDINGTVIQVADVNKCINNACLDYQETWVSKATPTVACTQSFETSTAVQTDGLYTVTLAPETCTTKDIYNAPTVVSYGGTTQYCPTNGEYVVTLATETCTTATVRNAPTQIGGYPCPTNGVYTITLQSAEYHTALIVNAPTRIVYPAVSQLCKYNGLCTITLAAEISITTLVFNAPRIVFVQKVTVETIIINSFMTVVDGITMNLDNALPGAGSSSTPPLIDPVSSVQSSSPVSSSPLPVPEFKLVTCSSTRSPFALALTSNDLSVEKCFAACSNSRFIGLAPTQCYCGDAFVPYKVKAAGACNVPCPGNPSQICGASPKVARREIPEGLVLSFYKNISYNGPGSDTDSAPIPDPSSDIIPREVIVPKPRARSLEKKMFKNPHAVRRGGLLRSPHSVPASE